MIAGPPSHAGLDELRRGLRPVTHEVAESRTGRRRRRVRWRRLLAGMLVALIAYYGITLFQVWSTGNGGAKGPADAIVVLGAAQYDGTPSPQLAERLDHALDLYGQGRAPVIVVTGGNQPGDRFTEAEAGQRYLTERGVPATAIVMETTGRTTFESLRNARALPELAGIASVLVVTDPYHALRSELTAEDVGFPGVHSSPTDASSGLGRYLGEAGGVAVGRIIGFDRLSDLVG